MTRGELERERVGALLNWVERELGLTGLELARTLSVDTANLDRWRLRESVPAPEQLRRTEELAQLARLVASAFRTLELGQRWLRQPVPALQGRTPISVLVDGDIDAVLTVLGAHVASVYV